MNVMNVASGGGGFVDGSARDVHRFIDRIIQHLNLKTIARVIDLSNCFHQPLDDIHFVEERKLHRNVRQCVLSKFTLSLWWKFRVAPEFDHLLDAIEAIDRQDKQNPE